MKFTLIAEREQIQDRKAGLKEKGELERRKEKGFIHPLRYARPPVSGGQRKVRGEG